MHEIRVSGVVVPEAALEWHAVRSSGPGGQNVNKVASKVELHVDLARLEGLTPPARRRLLELTRNRRDAAGRLLIRSQRTRDQGRNLEDAREKLRALLSRALLTPPERRRTQPPAASQHRRLAAKRLRSARKRERADARRASED